MEDKGVYNFVNDSGLQNEFEEYFETPYPDEFTDKKSSLIVHVEQEIDIDFSSLEGDFKKSFNKVKTRNEKINSVDSGGRRVIIEGNNNKDIFKQFVKKGIQKKKPQQPQPKKPIRTPRPTQIVKGYNVQQRAKIYNNNNLGTISRVITPDNRSVIVEGVDSFILSTGKCETDLKNINYHCGKKLKEMVLNINNDSPTTFSFELFNPSLPLDWLIANAQNINDRILVNDSGVNGIQYTDLLYNILANPVRIYNCKMIFDAPSAALLSRQQNEGFFVNNKDLRAYQVIKSINTNTLMDRYQFIRNILTYNVQHELGRPYVPDGMDVMKYVVHPGCSVAIVFYYEQIMLKKFFYKDLRNSKEIL